MLQGSFTCLLMLLGITNMSSNLCLGLFRLWDQEASGSVLVNHSFYFAVAR